MKEIVCPGWTLSLSAYPITGMGFNVLEPGIFRGNSSRSIIMPYGGPDGGLLIKVVPRAVVFETPSL